MKAGWEIKKLRDISRVVNGGTPKTGVPEYWNGHHRWITPAEMGKRSSRYVSETERTITDSGLQNSSAEMLPPYSVILSSRAPIGYLVINLQPMATNQGCKGIVPSKNLHHEFLYYYLSGNVDTLRSLGTGATFKELSGGKLKEVEIPLPPLPEQQRIVGILDEAFENIALATVNAEANLKNARALFESHLNDIFSKREEMWAMKKLGEIADVQSGGTPVVSRKDYWDGSIAWYSSGELNETFTNQPERTISELGLNSSNAKIFPKGSLLVGMYDTAALKMSILDREGAFNQAIAGVWPNPETDMAFVRYAIQAIKPKLLLERRGVRQKNLSLNKIREITIPFPPIVEQHRVAEQIEKLAVETQRLASVYHRKLAALDELKKSLLHQAFTGQL